MNDLENKVNIVDKVFKYLYNAEQVEVVTAVYGKGLVGSYVKEKMECVNNPARFWGALDKEHKARLVQVACDYYEYRSL